MTEKKSLPPDTVSLDDLRGHVAILQWAKLRKAELKEIEEKARAEIEAAMGESTCGLLDGEQVISWSQHKTSRFDKAQFEEDYPELAASYTKMTPARTFTLTNPDKPKPKKAKK